METKKVVKKETSVNNADLKKGLEGITVESVIQKTNKSKQVWKSEFKAKMNPNSETSARTKIRNEQFAKSKKLIASILTDQKIEVIMQDAQSLFDFYTEGLETFENYSNVSKNESPEKRAKIDKAYNKMKELLNV